MKKIIILASIIVLLLAGASAYYFFNKDFISAAQAKNIAEKFVNENLLPPTMKANIKNVVYANNVYDITLEVEGKDYHSFLSKDGKKFFQSGVDIAEIEKQSQNNQDNQTDQSANQPKTAVSVKTDKPQVELFVMSHCPYGTQIEKGILPVIKALGDKIDFALKFCSYAMHGKKELDEELNQYCIQKEQGGKLLSYLECFLKAGDSAACISQAGIDAGKLKNCVSATDTQYKITEKYNDKSTWQGGSFPLFDIFKADNEKYKVSGSPTLVVNGEQISSNRDSASLLNLICSAFNNKPAECNNVLSSATPAAGFGEGTSATNANADCATQ